MESASLCIEVKLMSVGDPGKMRVDVAVLQSKKDDALAKLHQETVLICDIGADAHVM